MPDYYRHRKSIKTKTGVAYSADYSIVALALGLVHGLGFAGALAEVGLPDKDILLAPLMFNVGVETGQIPFVVAAYLTIERVASFL